MPVLRVVGSLVLFLGSAGAVSAQVEAPRLPSRAIEWRAVMPDDAPAPGERLVLLQRWTEEYGEWKAWYARWRNHVEPGWFSARQRKQPPDPPAWLPAACGGLLEEEGPLVDACQAWAEWSRHDETADLLTQQAAQARTSLEAPKKTQWWERVHVDGLWPMTRSGASAFGLLGVHTTMHVTNRFQVFVTPGIILMRLPSVGGAQRWSAAADWGFTYSLFDFRMPGFQRPSTVHVNIARVWLLGNGAETLPFSDDLYLAGLSLTFKQR